MDGHSDEDTRTSEFGGVLYGGVDALAGQH